MKLAEGSQNHHHRQREEEEEGPNKYWAYLSIQQGVLNEWELWELGG